MSKLKLNPIGYLYHFNQDLFLSVYDGISIGKERGNIMVASDDLLSPLHCDFKVSDKKVIIRDLDSDSGVKVNGKFVTEEKLRFEDAIEIGNQKFRFVKKKRQMDENQFIRSYNPFLMPFTPFKWSSIYWGWSLVFVIIASAFLGSSHVMTKELPHDPIALLSLIYTILIAVYLILGIALNILEWRVINPLIQSRAGRFFVKSVVLIFFMVGAGPSIHYLAKFSSHTSLNSQNELVYACREESSRRCLREIMRVGETVELPWLINANSDGLSKTKKWVKSKLKNNKSKAKRELLSFIKRSQKSKNTKEIVILSRSILERVDHLHYSLRREKKLKKEREALSKIKKIKL